MLNVSAFAMHFFICSLWISVITGLLIGAKYMLRRHLSCRMQYAFRLPVFLLLAMPFFSFRPANPIGLLPILGLWKQKTAAGITSPFPTFPIESGLNTSHWMNDFAVSSGHPTASIFPSLFLFVWIAGMFVMLFLAIKARIRLYRLECSALPLQNKAVRRLYRQCLEEMNIRRDIPVYSSAFFRSPIFVGLFRPKIYLPVPMLSGCDMKSIRYMLLHELQHYRHKDSLSNIFLCLARVIYWFHPVVLLALKEIRADKERACDSSVLQMLPSEEYICYGNTLINFAEKLSSPAFLWANGMGGGMKQMKKRILNIADYRGQTKWQSLREKCLFALILLFFLESAARMPVYASQDFAALPPSRMTASVDLSTFFEGYDGCFALYDSKENQWLLYNKKQCAQRTAPESTYKIYSALLGLENKIITPDSTFMAWDGKPHAIEQWNKDQTLASAMQDSVNWYFQELDKRAGNEALKEFYAGLGYGNQDFSNGSSSFWLGSSLKISTIEQVELLRKLYHNEYHFSPENIQAVQNSIKLEEKPGGTLYGKTGTGNIDGENRNGWFIGYVETAQNTYFFATNIHSEANAGGQAASGITLEILREWGIF